MNKIRKIIKKVVANLEPIAQLIILVAIVIIVLKINGVQLLEKFYDKQDLGFDNLKYYLILKLGNIAIIALLDGLVLYNFRQHNKGKSFNRGNVYHNYPYIWFFMKQNFRVWKMYFKVSSDLFTI